METALLIAMYFRMVERVGASTEEPFANRTQDVPITALATNLERDLLELVDVPERPAKPTPVDGYLWWRPRSPSARRPAQPPARNPTE